MVADSHPTYQGFWNDVPPFPEISARPIMSTKASGSREAMHPYFFVSGVKAGWSIMGDLTRAKAAKTCTLQLPQFLSLWNASLRFHEMTLGIGVLQDSERIPIATWSLKQHHLDPRILGSFGCRFLYNPLPWDQLGGPALDASAVQQSVHCNIAVEWLQETKAWTKTSRVGVSIVMGLTPIAGWFMMENSSKNGWFRGTPILGNLYMEPCWCWQTYRIFWALIWGSCTLLGLDVCIGASLLWLHRTETPSGLSGLEIRNTWHWWQIDDSMEFLRS